MNDLNLAIYYARYLDPNDHSFKLQITDSAWYNEFYTRTSTNKQKSCWHIFNKNIRRRCSLIFHDRMATGWTSFLFQSVDVIISTDLSWGTACILHLKEVSKRYYMSSACENRDSSTCVGSVASYCALPLGNMMTSSESRNVAGIYCVLRTL